MTRAGIVPDEELTSTPGDGVEVSAGGHSPENDVAEDEIRRAGIG